MIDGPSKQISTIQKSKSVATIGQKDDPQERNSIYRTFCACSILFGEQRRLTNTESADKQKAIEEEEKSESSLLGFDAAKAAIDADIKFFCQSVLGEGSELDEDYFEELTSC